MFNYNFVMTSQPRFKGTVAPLWSRPSLLRSWPSQGQVMANTWPNYRNIKAEELLVYYVNKRRLHHGIAYSNKYNYIDLQQQQKIIFK